MLAAELRTVNEKQGGLCPLRAQSRAPERKGFER